MTGKAWSPMVDSCLMWTICVNDCPARIHLQSHLRSGDVPTRSDGLCATSEGVLFGRYFMAYCDGQDGVPCMLWGCKHKSMVVRIGLARARSRETHIRNQSLDFSVLARAGFRLSLE